MLCENCNVCHDGSYGSGRFCGSKCARGFSTKNNREAINQKISESLTGKPLCDDHPSKKGWPVSEEIKKKKAETFKRNSYTRLIESDFDQLKGHHRRKCRVIIEQDNKCKICSIESTWNGKPLVLHLDHIDGNNANNARDNLRAICPNCHSQTPTYAGRNKSKSAGL